MIFDEKTFESNSQKFKFVTKLKEEKQIEKNFIFINKNRILLPEIRSECKPKNQSRNHINNFTKSSVFSLATIPSIKPNSFKHNHSNIDLVRNGSMKNIENNMMYCYNGNEGSKELEEKINMVSPVKSLNKIRVKFINDFNEKYVKYKKLSMNEVREYTVTKINNPYYETQNKSTLETKTLKKIEDKKEQGIHGNRVKTKFKSNNDIEKIDFYKRIKIIEDQHDKTLIKLSNTLKVLENLKSIHSNRTKNDSETILKLTSKLNNSIIK